MYVKTVSQIREYLLYFAVVTKPKGNVCSPVELFKVEKFEMLTKVLLLFKTLNQRMINRGRGQGMPLIKSDI